MIEVPLSSMLAGQRIELLVAVVADVGDPALALLLDRRLVGGARLQVAVADQAHVQCLGLRTGLRGGLRQGQQGRCQQRTRPHRVAASDRVASSPVSLCRTSWPSGRSFGGSSRPGFPLMPGTVTRWQRVLDLQDSTEPSSTAGWNDSLPCAGAGSSIVGQDQGGMGAHRRCQSPDRGRWPGRLPGARARGAEPTEGASA